MSEKAASFSLKLDSNVAEVANKGAAGLEALKGQVDSSNARIKELNNMARQLRGSSDEIKAARKEINAQRDAERAKVSASLLQLHKLGTTYDSVTKQIGESSKATEEAKKKQEGIKDAVSRVGGPLGDLIGKFDGLSSVASKTGLVMGGFVTLAAAAVAAMVAMTAAAIAGAVAFAKWAIEGANAARSAALVREAWMGSAEQGENLGSQIDALAMKVPTAREALQDLSISLLKSKFSGQTLVDTFNAVGQASSALGDEVGGKLRAILERGILPNGAEGRFFVNPRELQGTGIAFEDLAKSLAKSSKRGVADAKAALLAGRVPLAEGAKAMRDAVEEKFGALNARKMLDLDVMKTTLGKSLGKLTKDIKIEPLLQAMQKLFDLLDPDKTDAGAALKELVSIVGNDLVGALAKSGDTFEDFFYGVLIGAIKTATFFYQVRNAIYDTFDQHPALKKFANAFREDVDLFEIGKVTAFAFAAAVVTVTVSLLTLAAAALLPVIAIERLVSHFTESPKKLKGQPWDDIGKSITDGIMHGLDSKDLDAKMKAMGESARDSFKKSIDAHSPSRLFAIEGRNIAAGVALGVRDGAPDVDDAIGNMAQPPAGGMGGGASALRGGPSKIEIHIDARGATSEAVERLESDSFRAKIVKVVEEALGGAGIPIMVGVPS